MSFFLLSGCSQTGLEAPATTRAASPTQDASREAFTNRDASDNDAAGKQVIPLDPSQKDYSRLFGFPNLGSTCWMNAALKVLSSHPDILKFLLAPLPNYDNVPDSEKYVQVGNQRMRLEVKCIPWADKIRLQKALYQLMKSVLDARDELAYYGYNKAIETKRNSYRKEFQEVADVLNNSPALNEYVVGRTVGKDQGSSSSFSRRLLNILDYSRFFYRDQLILIEPNKKPAVSNHTMLTFFRLARNRSDIDLLKGTDYMYFVSDGKKTPQQVLLTFSPNIYYMTDTTDTISPLASRSWQVDFFSNKFDGTVVHTETMHLRAATVWRPGHFVAYIFWNGYWFLHNDSSVTLLGPTLPPEAWKEIYQEENVVLYVKDK